MNACPRVLEFVDKLRAAKTPKEFTDLMRGKED
jgi:hypothetical protein